MSGVVVAVDYSVGIAFGGYCPSLLLYFCKMGQFGTHPHHSTFCGAVVLEVGCSWAWGSIFMGGFEVVAVVVLLVGGISQSFHSSKWFPDIFPASGHGVPVQTGMFSSGRGLLSEVPSGEGF